MGNGPKKRKPKRKIPARPIRPRSSLVDGLAEHARLRNEQRSAMKQLHPLTDAFDEVLEHLRVLSEIEGLDPELVHLLRDARRWLTAGVDRILSIPDPHSVEESRLLLELEYLLRDFAAEPAQLKKWVEAEGWKRPREFGFGKLREREEERRGLDEETVIAARDYWITHSVDSHPKPSSSETPPVHHWSFSMLSSLGDLVLHAGSVVEAAAACVTAFGATIPQEFDGLPTSAYTESMSRTFGALHPDVSEAELDAIRQPHLKKRGTHKFWRVGNDGADAAEYVGD
ncbi:MAG TPA: hypothetical protein VFE45_10375 [Coriobacteriia bacterium]|nr:hypothetical protein [Coriobacteriia bacterium]